MRCLIPLAAALLLAGCASIQSPLDDGYQFGDFGDLREQYCESADPQRRAVVLAPMYRAGVPLPPNGACADILEVLGADRDTSSPDDGQGAE